MIYSDRPWETSVEREVINIGEFNDRVHWGAFLGLSASTFCVNGDAHAIHTRHVNFMGLTQ
ncbi:hypothetical protein B9G53_16985 [Pseudanabaena sp. SR411]|uniref:hypothetical protein n=1 Tax=Pseudanabaena sp. SR411 TaxID=1980935 RepID=UPI000BC9E0AC|nr:hypothetical protein [Pseudanabaena sp. SR411]OYQ63464.1 hypothetical protein B9G53_16985 [Pseudanabaena sp. SR411]